MKLNKNLAISESGFIFNPSTGDSFSVNGIGAEVIQLLKEENTAEEIIRALLEKYDVEKMILPRNIVKSQLNNFTPVGMDIIIVVIPKRALTLAREPMVKKW